MTDILNREEAVLLVVDVQAKLVPAIHKELYPRSLKNMQIVIEAAAALGIPIFLTEQYPKGLGRTVPEVIQALDRKEYQLFEKVSFSCARDEEFLSAVSELNRRQVIILVGGVEHSQFLEYLGSHITPFVQADILIATLVLMWVGAFLSAVIDNIPFTAAMIPIIVGMEAHVCVYQTCVDLSRDGFSLFVLDDAVSSRHMHNYQSGLQALRDAGCTVVSTETAIFQLLKVSSTPEFKKVASLIK